VGVERVDVRTAEEMQEAVLEASRRADALLMAAAVGDYGSVGVATQKMKKGAEDLTLHLTRTPDILAAVARERADTDRPWVLVGFAAETEDLLENARKKLEDKQLDLIVANDVTAADAGFGTETNRVVLLSRDGETTELPLMSKSGVAEKILDRVEALLIEV
jgi:phosphopantothenoylcysteine decarboxylase/phosphopantothenate--cysteine ligase